MLRLLTYNIHGGIGHLGRDDPAAIVEVIESSRADIVALQEVYDDRGFLESLKQLDYAAVVHDPILRKSRGAYGNVLMSRVAPAEIQRIDLSAGGREPRGAIRFHLDLPEGPLDVCGVHLGLSPRERLRQIRQLDAILADADERHDDVLQVLMGDLNEWRPGTRFMRAVRRRFPHLSRSRTFPARRPAIALDRIGLRGKLREVEFRRIDSPPADRASDHRPLMAIVRTAGR
ncbi:endonuclease/exonuclease/phosphatase family protein [Haloferula sp. A504]|uniref:endonuclease/exonuclease/phosphatase family protein n=1 Tax=Haloferula sp. A504 TaxID=3373601 RepID=UPI0031C62C74|nr:endonuclease/exonuclease/phosphatase family protein [Verrucomicrobiaceae bacterium E54]